MIVFVDGENACPDRIPDVLNHVKQYGVQSCRIYADFRKAAQWQHLVETTSAEPIHVYADRPQAVDMTMALDILEAAMMGNDCAVVSGDQDFVPVLRKVRRYGRKTVVYVTHGPVANKLNAFHVVELGGNDVEKKESNVDKKLKKLIKKIIQTLPNPHPAMVQDALLQQGITCEKYKCKNFKELMERAGCRIRAEDRKPHLVTT